jgi:predicted flap endonuclease-1-like 5' DNA nuclease
LRGDLDNWRLRAEGAETELVNLRAQLAQSSTRFDAELSGWRLRAEGAETELANLRAQTSERATRFDADLGALRLRADGAETELTAVRSELSDLRVECGQKTEQLEITERELAQLRSDYAAMQSRGAGGALAAGAAGLAAGELALSGEPGRAEKAERASADLRALLAERVHTLHLTEAELARLRAEVIEARSAAAEMEDELAQVIAAPTRAAPRLDVRAAAGEPERDELILINGIGPVFEKRLNEAGILTFAQLAETPDERIVEIVKAKKWQAVDAPFWRRQARDFAAQKLAGAWTVSATQGDELILINGIGPVFERRLKNAGILTFAQLAETPNARILEIVKAKSWQAVDPDFWRRQAREFAAGRPE